MGTACPTNGAIVSLRPTNGAIRGRVTADGKGLSNVTVSDGLQCVSTDATGAFTLSRREGARFIAVSPPCGYQMKNWYRSVGVESGGVGRYDFALERATTGKAKCGCRFVHITDSEISDTGAENRKWIDDVRRIAVAEKCAFIVHTGDICYLKGMQAHAELMTTETMGLPMLYCLGNHDLVAGDYGEKAFEELFGPCRYSFNAGGIHFVVVPTNTLPEETTGVQKRIGADSLRSHAAPARIVGHVRDG